MEENVVFIIIYITKKNKIKNEFTIKPKSDLEHRTKLKGIMKEKSFSILNLLYILVSNTCIAREIYRYILVYKKVKFV